MLVTSISQEITFSQVLHSMTENNETTFKKILVTAYDKSRLTSISVTKTGTIVNPVKASMLNCDPVSRYVKSVAY